MQPKLLKDLSKLTDFCHTAGVEVHRSMILKYCLKREHFSHSGMVARTQLAAMDNNLNTGRKQAVIGRRQAQSWGSTTRVFPKNSEEMGC